MHVVFYWLSYKANIIKIQFMISMDAQKFNTGCTSYFNIGYSNVNRYLRAGNQMTFISIGFYKVFCEPIKHTLYNFFKFFQDRNDSWQTIYMGYMGQYHQQNQPILSPLLQKGGHTHRRKTKVVPRLNFELWGTANNISA